jgi:putative acetyltransferase
MTRNRTMNRTHVVITPFAPGDDEAFARLNLDWLMRHDLLEPADEKQLHDPEAHVFAHGGEIFVARVEDVPVGCCAAIPRGDGSMEVAKLAVEPGAQGHGIGRRLVHAALAFGQQRHYTKAVLTSSRKLKAALKLYESIGFQYAPLPAVLPYKTVDVYMELDLVEWAPRERP